MKFSGIVKKNLGRGKDLGFPTANTEAPLEIEDGIYVAKTFYNATWYNSIVFVGAAKTFNETKRQAEIYILDFNSDLYGQTIEVELIKKIRDNMKFETQEQLIEQMKKDEEVARDYFSTNQSPPSGEMSRSDREGVL